MLLFSVYLLFELGYYLYCRVFIYNVLNNIDYNKNRQVITTELSADLYTMLKEYFTKEEDLVKFFTDAIPNKRLLTVENIKKLMAYHIYNRHPNSDIDISEYDNLNEIIDIIRPKLGSLIQPDTFINDKDTIISTHYPTNKMAIIHKPFVFNLFLYILRKLANFYMYMLGFSKIIDPKTQLRVWIKYNKVASNKTPLVFIHGLGIGIVLYLLKIPTLSADRTLILPELPNISFDLYKYPVPTAEELVSSFYDILIGQGIELVDLIGHSYGGIILNILQLKYPHMCNYKTYVESPVFCIQQSHTAKTLYMKPWPIYIRKYVMYLFVVSDTYVQYILKRGMFSDQGIIKNLDEKTTVILAKDDYLVPSYYIHRYITLHYPQVKAIMTEGDHGTYIVG